MQQYISRERLAIYESCLKVKKNQSLAAYHWNKALTGALVPVMQCLEVTLRNALDHSVKTKPPAGAKGLYQTDSNWITSLPDYMANKTLGRKRYTKPTRLNKHQKVDKHGYLLLPNGKRKIVKRIWEEGKLESATKKIIHTSRAVTPDRLISMMDFGFWTNLLTVKYEDADSQSLLWPNLLTDVFPNAPLGTSRADIEIKFNRIRELRNRLSHHEAIWKFYEEHPTSNKPNYNAPIYGTKASCSLLKKNYDEILELIGWMSKERLDTFKLHGSGARFTALCSVEGLNCFIAPEKVSRNMSMSFGGKGVKKIIRALKNNEFIHLTKNGKTVAVIGVDTLIQFHSKNINSEI